MNPNTSRPSLGQRAVSDMAPLVSPSVDYSKGELSRGTHAVHGGVRVVSGKKVALGGVAPISPFLPLPPAPTRDEVRRQFDEPSNSLGYDMTDEDEEEARYLSIIDQHQRRASSHDIATGPKPNAQKPSSPHPAPFMIRSYSMPVATQNDFEAQQRASRLRRQQQQQSRSRLAWSMSRTNSTESEGDAPSLRSPLRTFMKTEMNSAMDRSYSQSSAEDIPASTPIVKSTSKWEAPSTSLDNSSISSGSDETDVCTPRAGSPSAGYLGETGKDEAEHAVADLHIHPDHLHPPPIWSIP